MNKNYATQILQHFQQHLKLLSEKHAIPINYFWVIFLLLHNLCGSEAENNLPEGNLVGM